MPRATVPRTARIEARIAPEALDMARRAAELEGRSVSDFIVAAAVRDAQRTVEVHQVVRLSVDGQQRFAEALLDPPALAPAMKRAMQERRRLIDTTR